MVERPIKKSERQAKENLNGDHTGAPQPSEERSAPRAPRSKERGKGKGRGNGRDEAPRQAVNPALMRGPKPEKAKPPEPEAVPVEATDEVAVDVDTATEDAAVTADSEA